MPTIRTPANLTWTNSRSPLVWPLRCCWSSGTAAGSASAGTATRSTAPWQRNRGQITLLNASATGDAINDAAITLLWRLGGTVDTRRFINEFATTDLYEQVRDHLVGSGILRPVTRRRFWFLRTLIHLPNSAAHPVCARARIRSVARLYRPRPQDTALAALVTGLGLTPYLYFFDTSTVGVHVRLAELIGPRHPIRDVTAIIAPHRITYQ